MILVNLILSALLVVLCASGDAQQTIKIPRIGYVSGTGTSSDQGPYVEALRQGLRNLGYVEGKNFVIEYRGAEGNLERIQDLVNDLVQIKVDVIVAPVPGAIRAAKQASKTIPIVMVTGIDPVANGWVASLARPGGNITGIATLTQDLNGKRLELLTEVVPRLSHVAVLWIPDPASTVNFKEYEAAARALKVQLQSLEQRSEAPDIEAAFKTAVKDRAGAVIVITTAALFIKQKQIADLAMQRHFFIDLQPVCHNRQGAVTVFTNVTIGLDSSLDHSPDFIMPFFDFLCACNKTTDGKAEKLVRSR